MSQQKKTTPVAKPVAAAKPPKKLIPRPAPKAEPVEPIAPEAVAPAAPVEAVMPAATTAAAKAAPKAARKPSAVDETVARHQKVLAEALVKAQAINYDQPVVVAPPAEPKAGKAAKPAKIKKSKLVRDSYAMPETEYAAIAQLKKRLAGGVKKSELLRAGLALLAGLNDAELLAAMSRIERIKTGRPAK